jgi:hypothetical protein
VAEHHRARELVVLLRFPRVALNIGNGGVDRGDLGSRALRDDRNQSEMVDVLVRQDDELDVLD